MMWRGGSFNFSLCDRGFVPFVIARAITQFSSMEVLGGRARRGGGWRDRCGYTVC